MLIPLPVKDGIIFRMECTNTNSMHHLKLLTNEALFNCEPDGKPVSCHHYEYGTFNYHIKLFLCPLEFKAN